MPGIERLDPMLAQVQRSVRQYGLIDGGPMGQQILLLGDTFYGYRFTSREFTAVWSAADQTLNVFDQFGKQLGTSLMSVESEAVIDLQGTIRLPEKTKNRIAA